MKTSKKPSASRYRPTTKQKKWLRGFQWFLPGLLVKRWLFVSIIGIILIVLGIAISARLTPILFLSRVIGNTLDLLVSILPRNISGPIALAIGLGLLWFGQKRALGSITQVLMPDQDKELVDLLVSHRKLNRGPKIVTVGGGTGLSNLLRGLKQYSANITAIVTVADDGGSSGRLRREHGVLPPGDIRNCLAALADEEKLVTELFQYRFKTGEGLSGHSFGNLFLTAMSEVTGDLEKAIAASSQVLAVRGRVLPATLDHMVLWAEFEDGRYVEGESNIPEAKGKIKHIGCKPENPKGLPQAIDDINEADLIIIGPGSLYTSIIPNLLVPDILQALINRNVPSIYLCNIMSQVGETDGYTVSDYVRVLDELAGVRLFDVVLVQKYPPSERSLQHYESFGSHFTYLDRENLAKIGCPVLVANIMREKNNGTVCHDSEKLAGVLMRWYNRQ
ncbi:YvcK family protein [Pseudanabaena sp. FACHB-1998]|uniref:gluconeogenesis factor YvcK family protein n=1 Tax=Pseudanabaena sp. FACHB-1998 TaxID=2692858 RepID=UPI00168015DC|nr:gluconeogenesis factor YvcK family protein [Pseudanabaena sp. FACHB-1998]MBD2178521.1 YvcK family protein [Pseudanabaena sp. FACHB-1998]